MIVSFCYIYNDQSGNMKKYYYLIIYLFPVKSFQQELNF